MLFLVVSFVFLWSCWFRSRFPWPNLRNSRPWPNLVCLTQKFWCLTENDHVYKHNMHKHALRKKDRPALCTACMDMLHGLTDSGVTATDCASLQISQEEQPGKFTPRPHTGMEGVYGRRLVFAYARSVIIMNMRVVKYLVVLVIARHNGVLFEITLAQEVFPKPHGAF